MHFIGRNRCIRGGGGGGVGHDPLVCYVSQNEIYFVSCILCIPYTEEF